jgi:hypothetical protein
MKGLLLYRIDANFTLKINTVILRDRFGTIVDESPAA